MSDFMHAQDLVSDPGAERKADKQPNSDREQEHAAMLEEALARPGVREAMQVFGGWQEKDRSLDAYRAATKAPMRTTTTDSSNID